MLAGDRDLEVLARQVRDGFSVTVRYDGVDGDEIGGRAKDGSIRGSELVLGRERDSRHQQDAEEKQASADGSNKVVPRLAHGGNRRARDGLAGWTILLCRAWRKGLAR